MEITEYDWIFYDEEYAHKSQPKSFHKIQNQQ